MRSIVVDAEAKVFTITVQTQVAMLREVIDPDNRSGKTRRSADAERPARTEPISDPSDDGRANRRAAQSDGEEDGYHPSTHRWLG